MYQLMEIRRCTDQYYEETEKAEKQLEEDILSGKYGEDIKRIIRVNINQFRYNCNTKLYQCSKCREFTVIREKMIKYGNFSEPFEITIEFKKECPACGHDFMIKPSNGMAACPKCDRGTLDLISLGKWD